MLNILDIVDFLSNLFTIVASGIAIYLFITKRKVLSSVINILLTYSQQMTLSEMKAKLERISELTMEDDQQALEIINLLNDIVGQIKGNKKLFREYHDILSKLERYANGPRYFSEPKKRALVSELRERLRHINIQNIDDMMGDER